MTKRTLKRAFNKFDVIKKTRDPEVPGILGFTINGKNAVEVGNRAGYVWVRLRSNTNEVIQAYNDQVSPVYGLPVVVVRDEIDRTKYKIKGRDLGTYQNWGGSAYLPRHGNQHSFNPEAGGGGDVVFVFSRQFMPLALQPSGTSGAGCVLVQPYAYYQGTTWKYAGGTGTASFLPYKPTGSNARMVLVYLDNDSNPQLLAGSDYFAASITGNAAVLPYVPAIPDTSDIPLGAVRLVSGTSAILWDNIYDLRPIIVSDGFIPTGSSTSGHEIQKDGTPLADRAALNFVGSGFAVYNTAGATNVSGTASGGSTTNNYYSTPNTITVLDDHVFKVSGTAIDFTDNISVAVTGSVAFISSTGGGGEGGSNVLPIQDSGTFVVTGTALSFDGDLLASAVGTVGHVSIPAGTFASGSHTHPAGSAAIQIFDGGTFVVTGTAIDFQDNLEVFSTGTVAFVKSYGNLVYSVSGTSNPPTEAELISAFGTPDTFHTRKQIGHLNDADSAINEYLVVSDGSHYWTSTLAKAAVASLSIAGTTGTVEATTAGLWYGRASLERLPDDTWVLAYREAPAHADNSVDVLHIRFSSNQGQTWTARDQYLDTSPVSGFPMYPAVAGTGTAMGPGEPWLILAPNNDLLLHMWAVDYGVSNSGTYQSRSTDGGKTWSSPASINFIGVSNDQNIFMTDDHFVYNGIIYAGARIYDNPTPTNIKSVLMKSVDNGVTWEYISDISSFTEDTNEVALEYLGNGKILALLRDFFTLKTYKATSTDMGLTWSALSDIAGTFNIMGRTRMMTRSHLKGYDNWWEDKVLLVFGHIFPTPGSGQPRRNAVWVSQDGGDTWNGPNYVDAQTEDAGYGDMLYSSIQDKYVFVCYQGALAAASVVQYNLAITGI